MGERWLDLPFSQVGDAERVTVEARAQVLDHQQRAVATNLKWMSADPTMVTVGPEEGSQVTISVLRAGETSLRIDAGTVSRQLAITAEQKGGALYVTVTPGS